MLKKILNQYKTWTPKVATKNIIYHAFNRERRRSFGDANTNLTFYVIRSINDRSKFYTGPIHNLLANYFYVLSHLQYAQIQGWTPVIDQVNYPVYNKMESPVMGTSNPWEYFWEQPCGFSLEEVYRSKSVVLSKRSWFGQWDMGYDAANYTDRRLIGRYHRLAEMTPLNRPTLLRVNQAKEQLLPCDGKILGVSFRFDGHALNNPHPGPGHPIQPSIDELIMVVRSRLDEWGMRYVFLASDEEHAVRRFQNEFGDRLLVLRRSRCCEGNRYGPENPNPMYLPGSLYQTSLDYLTEMELLACCDALIGSVTSGLRYAVVKNNGRYEQTEILDCGRFPDPKRNRSGSAVYRSEEQS